MYKPLSDEVMRQLEDVGDVVITIKPGWETSGQWTAKPAYINYYRGTMGERIFRCYYDESGDTLSITHVEATKMIGDKKALVDGYLFVALKGLINHASSNGKKRLIVESYIPAIADHMLDLGFSLQPKGLQPGGYGCKLLKE